MPIRIQGLRSWFLTSRTKGFIIDRCAPYCDRDMDTNPQNNVIVHLLLRGDMIDQEDKYVEEFGKRNMLALAVPILDFKFINQELLRRRLLALRDHECGSNGLLLTSPRAVDCLESAFDSIDPKDRAKILQGLNCNLIFVVGQKTGSVLEKRLGLSYNKKSCKAGSFESLSEIVESEHMLYKSITTEHINLLYPRSTSGNQAVEEKIAKLKHINLLSCSAYETNVKDDLYHEILHRLESYRNMVSEESGDDKPAIIINLVFFSPSGVKGVLGIPREKLEKGMRDMFSGHRVKIVNSSIGATTEKALLSVGIQPFGVAREPTPTSLAEALAPTNLYAR